MILLFQAITLEGTFLICVFRYALRKFYSKLNFEASKDYKTLISKCSMLAFIRK